MNTINRIGTGRGQVKQRLGYNPKNNFGNFVTDFKGQDARLKLIRKKRQNMKDARDKLAEIARGGDARERINKLKAKQNAFIKPSINVAAQHKTNIMKSNPVPLMKNNVNGANTKINLKKVIKTTGLKGRTQIQAGSLKRTVSGGGGGPKVVSKITNLKSKLMQTTKKVPTKSPGDRFHPLPNNPNVVTIRNDRISSSQSVSNVAGNQSFPRSSRPQQREKNFYQSSSSGTMKNTLSSRNSYPSQSVSNTFKGNVWDYNQDPYGMVDEIKPTRLKITTLNNYMNYDQPIEENWEMQNASRSLGVKRNMYDDYDDFSPPLPKKQALLSSSIISRLDQPTSQVNSGYKVVVTNLHPVVTVEDVEELFRNIGPIRYARMIRDGMAEVIFESEMDAYRSVEVYHNRQLDGQAMNVSVMNKNSYLDPEPPSRYSSGRSSNNYQQFPQQSNASRRSYSSAGPSNSSRMGSSTKSVLRTAAGSLQNGRDSGMSSITGKRYQKVDVSPDIGVIHHALFSNKNSSSNSNMQVYIKLPKSHIRGSK